MGWIRKRLGESSTHMGLALITGGLTAYMEGGSQAAIAAVVSGLFSVLYPQSGAK
jgi:hypothetical protein